MAQQHDQSTADTRKQPVTADPRKPRTDPPKPKQLPPWKVLLHNDPENTFIFVTRTICELTPLGRPEALRRTDEAHTRGVSLLLTTHQERAELYQQQFTGKGITVTIEADEP